MVNQNNPKLLGPIQNWGCGIISLCYIARNDWTVDEVNALYNRALKAKAITEGCDITWEPFVKLVSPNLQWVKMAEPKYQCSEGEFEISQYYNQRTGFKHFVVTANGEVVFDPLVNSVTVREGYCIGKRIIKKV